MTFFNKGYGNYSVVCQGRCLKSQVAGDLGCTTFVGMLVYTGFFSYLATFFQQISIIYVVFGAILIFLTFLFFLYSTFTEPGILPTPLSDAIDNRDLIEAISIELPHNFNGLKQDRYEFNIQDVDVSPQFKRLSYKIKCGHYEDLINAVQETKNLLRSRDSDGLTLLHYSVIYNKPEIFKILLQLGADPLYENSYFLNILHYICLNDIFWDIFREFGNSNQYTRNEIQEQLHGLVGKDYTDGQGAFYSHSTAQYPYILGKNVWIAQFCRTCKMAIPPRSSHCSSCNVCVRRYDHHCPWISNCVGLRNYRYFMIYIILLILVPFYFFIPTIHYYVYKSYHLNSSNKILEYFVNNIPNTIFLIINLVLFLTVLPLFMTHIKNIRLNQTTDEMYNNMYGDMSPFQRGLLYNIRAFICTSYESIIS